MQVRTQDLSLACTHLTIKPHTHMSKIFLRRVAETVEVVTILEYPIHTALPDSLHSQNASTTTVLGWAIASANETIDISTFSSYLSRSSVSSFLLAS